MEQVILGMPGPWADDNFEAADHYTTKIGGIPDWPCLNLVIKPDLLRCDSCGDNLCLVTQIYAPISSKILTVEERVIYIFACVAATCETTSWRALRVQRCLHDKEPETSGHDSCASPLTPKLKDDPWAFDFDEENDDEDEIDLDALGRALTEATTLASASQTKRQNTWPEAIAKCSPISLRSRAVDDKTAGGILMLNVEFLSIEEKTLPVGKNKRGERETVFEFIKIKEKGRTYRAYTYFNNNEEEKYSKDVASISSSISSLHIKENQSDDNEHTPEEAWEGESYEYDRALNADRTYLKFKKRLDKYPEQCFRYSYGGKPLLASVEAGDPGRCLLCGELRHYELQMMPPLLYYLQEAKATTNYSLESWNWMSLIVYTCSKGCAPTSKQESDGWVVAEEAVVVQTE